MKLLPPRNGILRTYDIRQKSLGLSDYYRLETPKYCHQSEKLFMLSGMLSTICKRILDNSFSNNQTAIEKC
ncbi:hypothetical protein EPI10_023519 [Gossypium australe]|uniref:Uncharacterized protein n=1 Tax=Gossypium australe TaxID=47621 RepID=A0A5B6VV14_9ROSI|nr:hypothetical protein EPI10_023519 [Gossypium australe]